MGNRGPTPLSADKLKIRGSSLVSSRRRAEQGRVLGTGGRLTCPQWLGAEQRAVWRRVVAALRPYGILRPADATALGRYCTSWVLWRRLVEARDASPVNDPSTIRLERRALKVSESLLKLESSFGMNPASRARLGLAKPTPSVPPDDSRLLRLLPGPDADRLPADPDDDPGDDEPYRDAT